MSVFVIVSDLQLVGMHHWCHRKFDMGELLEPLREPSHEHDENAIALLQGNDYNIV